MILFYEQDAGELSEGQCEGVPVRAYSEGKCCTVYLSLMFEY